MGHISKLSEHLMVIIYLQPMYPQLEVIEDFSEGGAIPKGGGQPSIQPKFPKKLFKNEENWAGGVLSKIVCVDPTLAVFLTRTVINLVGNNPFPRGNIAQHKGRGLFKKLG